MNKHTIDRKDRQGTEEHSARATTLEPKIMDMAPLDICDSAHTAEIYRLEKSDEACDDGIK